ncbi:MAG TPA: GNAT family N-acetyltransferase [Candidatus Saccharimonadales bacterium]|jgi:GNAT superfamily N-acetyltransferase|nr:GNAT family N-acetyltransferase [Candidatus Saccharimonadales bacterium]
MNEISPSIEIPRPTFGGHLGGAALELTAVDRAALEITPADEEETPDVEPAAEAGVLEGGFEAPDDEPSAEQPAVPAEEPPDASTEAATGGQQGRQAEEEDDEPPATPAGAGGIVPPPPPEDTTAQASGPDDEPDKKPENEDSMEQPQPGETQREIQPADTSTAEDSAESAAAESARPPHDATVRSVTAESLAGDLAAKRLDVPPPIAEGLADDIADGSISFIVAESPQGEPRGQIGINWEGPRTPAIRDAIGAMPGLAFVEVAEPHRQQGIAQDLLHAAYGEALARGHSSVFLTVEANNTPAINLYRKEGFVDAGVSHSLDQFVRDPDGVFRGAREAREMHVFIKHLDPRR